MKNYTFLPLIIVLLISFNSHSQNFAPVGAKWHYNENNYGPPPYYINYILVESIKDTIVLGKNAKKLDATWYWATGGISLWDTYITYSDSNKVYLYRCNQFYLLYDFNANQGDTIHIVDPECGWWDDTLIDVLIDSVTMENIGGVMKKVQYVTSIEGWGIGTKFIESIGSDQYLLPVNGSFSVQIGPLRCYSDSLINYQLVLDCEELVVGVAEDMEQTEMLIYPNPSSGIFNVAMNAEQAEIEVFSITGQLVERLFLKNGIGTINITTQPKGLYLVKMKTSYKTIVRKIVYQ